MEKIEIIERTKEYILVKDTEKIEEIQQLIYDEEDFIIQQQKDGRTMSELIISEGLAQRLKDGSFKLLAGNVRIKTVKNETDVESFSAKLDKATESNYLYGDI